MHASVRSNFVKFSESIEGRVEYMYLDIKGLVTIGIGNLFDVEKTGDTAALMKVMEELVKLPFVYKDTGMPASKADIEAQWKMVKKKQEGAKAGHTAFAGITTLKLKPDAIDTLALTKANKMEQELKADPAYHDFDKWPADAQLSLLSMAWALGTPKLRTEWPKFKATCGTQDFDAAAKHCRILDVNNPGVTKRNADNLRLFKNAAAVLANDGKNLAENIQQRLTLHYPHSMLKKITIRG